MWLSDCITAVVNLEASGNNIHAIDGIRLPLPILQSRVNITIIPPLERGLKLNLILSSRKETDILLLHLQSTYIYLSRLSYNTCTNNFYTQINRLLLKWRVLCLCTSRIHSIHPIILLKILDTLDTQILSELTIQHFE